MNQENLTAIVISASSDIGTAICHRWLNKGFNVCGTYRTLSQSVDQLQAKGVKLVRCDLSDIQSVRDACATLRRNCPKWDILVLASGMLEPVGPFIDCDIDDWSNSICVNFTNQIYIVHELLPVRNSDKHLGPCVLFFAGGGTNKAVLNHSAYTVSKIALIKICELLDAEISDTRFVILGPGWVKTKIHQSTLDAGTSLAGSNYERTKHILLNDECTPMENVLDCCDWLASSPREVVGGRNFSVVYDLWGTEELTTILTENPDMYKLRRYGNNWKVNNEKSGD